ncbi:hypothetical protein C8T65DRAFT_740400 [Cerioporus squamosus]|nr:hypothetical protein C8T65DRAFT_740400 [Cerioporus squamosus]
MREDGGYKHSGFLAAPFNKKKHKNNDPAKVHTKSAPTAQQTRKILMSDGVDCSILMGFPQFMNKYLGVTDTSGFPEDKAQKVRDAFVKTLGLTRGPGGRMVKSSGSLLEKDWSTAWEAVAADKTLPTELCPGFVFNKSEEGKDKEDNSKLRIDASLISVDDSKTHRFKANQPNWSLQRLPIEFKRGGATYDPFDDNPKHKHEADLADRRGVYGQLMTYAERVFVHQHRKSLFFLFVNGPEFRVMFFDHGGVITTEAIDYISSVEGTAALLSFLHAFSELDDRRQGVDTTAILLSPESCGYKRMDALKNAQPDDLAHHARYVDDASTIPDSFLDSSDPAEAVDAMDYGDQETETTNYSPVTGRKKVEDWTPYVRSVQTKKAAKRRAATKVGDMKPNSKHAAAQGDRGKKRTVDERIAEENSQQGQGLCHLIHNRLVVKEVCLPLTAITSSRQLVIVMIDGIAAHEMAYKRCKLIHRDVSFGNMLIYPSVKEVKDSDHPDEGRRESKTKYAVIWKGLLTDWELAKDWTILRALQPERTGTWHFMSRNILTHADQLVTIPDELESFVHVLIYAAVRLVDHNISDIRGFIHYYFDGYVITEDGYGCPAGKRTCITEAKLDDSEKDILFCAENVGPDDHPLNELVGELLALIRTRYTVLDWETRASKKKSGKRVSSSPSVRPDTTQQWESYSDLSDAEEDTQTVDGDMDVDNPSGKGSVRQTMGESTLPREPSPATVAKAKSLEKHSSVRLLLQKYLNKSMWPADDTVRDRLVKFNPRPRESLSDIEDTSAPKKARTDSGAKPAATSRSKNRGSRKTQQKTRSEESLGDHDTATSSSGPAASSSGGAARRVTRSADCQPPP